MVLITDRQVTAIANAARPLLAQERQPFMAAVAEALLNRRDAIGDGELHRLLHELQRRYFKAPVETEDQRVTCYSRRHGAGLRAFERG